MECNRISCGKRRRSGFTIVEFMVAMSIGLLVLGAALVLWAFASKTCASLFAYVDLSSTSKNAVDRVSQLIRNTKRVQSCSSNMLVLIDVSGQTNILSYSASQKKLTATKNSVTKVLLTECTNFQFAVYQRTPISNSMVLYTNGFATNTARVVQMQWTCKRTLTGEKDNIETQMSAKVVIRNP
jgi:prepilin-type N-terminal cleavage/methylation domain-containing protein